MWPLAWPGFIHLNEKYLVIGRAPGILDRLFLGKALFARQDVNIDNKHCSHPDEAHGPEKKKVVRKESPDIRVSRTVVLQTADHEEVQDRKKEHGLAYKDQETANTGGHFALFGDYAGKRDCNLSVFI